MNATELRKGSTVYLSSDKDGSRCEINITVSDLVKIELGKRIYNPIPLTEEQLLKLGYSIDESFPAFYQVIGHRIWMCNELFLCDKNGVVLKYVHQLQNLYYALTNTELTIKQ